MGVQEIIDSIKNDEDIDKFVDMYYAVVLGPDDLKKKKETLKDVLAIDKDMLKKSLEAEIEEIDTNIQRSITMIIDEHNKRGTDDTSLLSELQDIIPNIKPHGSANPSEWAYSQLGRGTFNNENVNIDNLNKSFKNLFPPLGGGKRNKRRKSKKSRKTKKSRKSKKRTKKSRKSRKTRKTRRKKRSRRY